jgi:hypothetical protein
MSNPLYDGIVKVGITERTPEERAKELYTTGVPLPFKVEFAKRVSSPKEKESLLHKILEQYAERVNGRREFFRVTVEVVRTFFGLMDGEWWKGEQSETDDGEEEVEEKEASKRVKSTPGCRDMAKCFTNGQKIRHVIGIDLVRIGVYDAKQNGIVCGDNVFTLNGFAKDHYREKRPERVPNVNAWKECECEVDGKWVSTFSLPE